MESISFFEQETLSKGFSHISFIEKICAPIGMFSFFKNCIQTAPAKQSGAVNLAEKGPPPRMSLNPECLKNAGKSECAGRGTSLSFE